jgi:hypothetical protein
MKKSIIVLGMFLALVTFSYGGNGDGQGNGNINSACNCAGEVNMYAAGTVQWISHRQIKCKGESGTCWEIKYQDEEWVLTIYSNPPVILGGGNNEQDNPPVAPQPVEKKEDYILYEVDRNVWRKSK